MKKYIILTVALILGIICQKVISAERQIFTDKSGTVIMRAYPNGNGMTRYYDGKGNYQGFSYQNGSRVNYYNKHSERLGSATQINNGFRYFNNNGKEIGQSKTRR